MKKSIIILIAIATSIFIGQSCQHDPKTDAVADSALFAEVMAGTYTNYKNGNILAGIPPSPHGNFTLRFNEIATAALDSATGELPAGATFPNGSIIVKDIYEGSKISLIAVMKKAPSDQYASNGWVWAEYNPDGSIYFSTIKKGDGCTGCHGSAPHRDFTKAFDLH